MINLFKKVSAVTLVIAMLTSMTNVKLNIVKADDVAVLTSPEISVVGYQMKTLGDNANSICFRTICKAPDIGSVITVNNVDYTITNLGTVYTKDINTTGYNEYNSLDKSYIALNPTPYPQYFIDAYGFKYIGIKKYLDETVTFGYVATAAGITEQTDGYTTYVRTMTDMYPYVTNTIYTRGFVEAVDPQGNDVIIYGEYASMTSVANIAYKVYTDSKAPTAEGHKFLFTDILNKLPEENPYYRATELEYGWSGSVNP